MIVQQPMLDAVNTNFERYAGNVILDRAICDARDMLKPSARMMIYSQLSVTKNLPDKPFIKSARVIGDCLGHFYEHGDSSCYEAYMRMSKAFAMRYPLEECQGNNGTVVMLNDEAAMRYTELRLSGLSKYLYGGLEENAIKDWKINFDKTEQYPSVMPSVGYFNLCNGTIGLGVGISSQIPQFNLVDVNNALIKLIQNPNISDDEIAILPDFATGAILVNPDEVRQSLLDGKGKACRLRAKMVYNPVDNSIKVTEIPYGIGTDTIREEIAHLVEKDEDYGIDSINDKSGKTVDFTIFLKKHVNSKKMIQKLYKDTSLESTTPIVMWVLDKGRFPTIMGLRQLFNAYITHCRETETNILSYEVEKMEARKIIIDGLLRANTDIDNVIATIRSAASSDEAQIRLMGMGYNEVQSKAILAIRLSSLTKLDTEALQNEYNQLLTDIKWHNDVLSDSKKLDEVIIQKLQEVIDKFGDDRRTTILSTTDADIEDTITDKPAGLILFDNNMMRAVDMAELQPGNRGRKGINIKPPRGAAVKSTIYTSTSSTIALFTDAGKMYTFSLADMTLGQDYSVYEFIKLQADGEKVVEMADASAMATYPWTIFITKNGLIKKTETCEYTARARDGFLALKLVEGDMVQNVFFSKSHDDMIMIASKNGKYVYYPQSVISATGRVAQGVVAMKLMDDDYIVDATIVYKDRQYRGLLAISRTGCGKISPLEDYPSTSRAIQGNYVMKIDEGDEVSAISVIPFEQDRVSFLNGKVVVLDLKKIPTQSRHSKGVRLIDNRDEKNPIYIL